MSGGGTKIIAGLEKATSMIEKMAQEDKDATHTLILLSDGDETLKVSKVQPIHTRLAAVKARVFAIGIGEKHKKETLKLIAPKTGKFKGRYIDTTIEGNTIGSAISTIYEQAIAVFSNLVLSCSQLETGQWSVGDADSIEGEGQSEYQLGSFTGEKGIVKTIKISKHRQGSLDLSKVSFKLTFTDPRGREGALFLPWNPNFIINPEILS